MKHELKDENKGMLNGCRIAWRATLPGTKHHKGGKAPCSIVKDAHCTAKSKPLG